jgi:putative endonuclease
MGRLFVYILECDDKSYYVGITNNLRRRLGEHNSKSDPNAFTAFRLPVRLIHYTVFKNPVEAIAFEKKLKGWSRKKKEAYMLSDWAKLKALAACRNPTRFNRPKPSTGSG